MAIARMILVTTVIFTLGMLVLPSTINLLAGGHAFYNLEQGYGNKCVKCHADIYEELKTGANHSTVDGETGLSGEECLGCHRANLSITYANSTTNTPGKEAHAATTITCSYCHFNSSNTFGAPVAGGFGLSNLANDTGINASHYSFVVESIEGNLLQNESEACVACHTTINVTINYNMSSEVTIVVNNTYSGWDVKDMYFSEFTAYTEVKG
jgi:hypothetical protein